MIDYKFYTTHFKKISVKFCFPVFVTNHKVIFDYLFKSSYMPV